MNKGKAQPTVVLKRELEYEDDEPEWEYEYDYVKATKRSIARGKREIREKLKYDGKVVFKKHFGEIRFILRKCDGLDLVEIKDFMENLGNAVEDIFGIKSDIDYMRVYPATYNGKRTIKICYDYDEEDIYNVYTKVKVD